MTITIDSPQSLTDYFNTMNCCKHVYGVLDGLVMVGWHPEKIIASRYLKTRPNAILTKVYKSL